MKTVFKWLLWSLSALVVSIFLVLSVIHLATTPSNDRDWSLDQAVLPYGEISGDMVTIHNIRNFTYTSTKDYIPEYYDKTFDLSKIKNVYYIVEPFSGVPGSAHTFLSFEFEDEQFVAISVEIRKEKGESYHPLKGLFNQYEITYVIGDERDLIKLRTNYRKDLVYVYPAKTTKEKMQQLFVGMVRSATDLKDHPEFYNTLTNTCTTRIVHHVNTVTPDRVPFLNWRILLPEGSDRLAYDLGLIDTSLSFEETRKRYFINDRAQKYALDEDFSVKIREDE
ncbi:MAG: hypothetical protein A2494_03200 [Candidatus Lloydbacteria bacterium RIFOXYC12_FULL_46_25]|uniref:Lnb N-terminal periplasmic domain-containing protein n=1 Tax=Candidatus Lloydbacteria bacterium RIFOXYC12_FULL_46_25 TaxID=1798670 RepID=A0A1G2DU56_9BACT|nr:MAG: hypothetical protein A2494_03200 [Candidatus Lloydbacteria bacterium RIFOXYC12_FULL_46_25]